VSDPTDYTDRLNLREQIARIDNMIDDTNKKRHEQESLHASTQKVKLEYLVLPWQVVATVFGAGAAFFAAGAAFVKLVGG
jgi:hypothetical protein